MISTILSRTPIIGFALRCAEEGRAGDLALLVANLLMAAALAVIFFGLSAFVPILYAVLIMVASVIFTTTLAR